MSITVTQLTVIGRALHGNDWQRALARDLGAHHPAGARDGIESKSIRRWVSGKRPVPSWVGDALPYILAAGAEARLCEAAVLKTMAATMGG